MGEQTSGEDVRTEAEELRRMLAHAIDRGIEDAAAHLERRSLREFPEAIRRSPRPPVPGPFPDDNGMKLLVESAYLFGVANALRLGDHLPYDALGIAVDLFSRHQRLLSEAILVLPRPIRTLVGQVKHEVGASWGRAVNGAAAVSHLAFQAKEEGLSVRFPTEEEDVRYKIDLLISSATDCTNGCVIQVKATRKYYVSVFTPFYDPLGWVEDTFRWIDQYRLITGIQWTPVFASVGLPPLQVMDLEGSHRVRRVIQTRLLPLLS